MQVRTYLGPNEDENYVLRAFHEGCPADKTLTDLDHYEPSDLAVVFGTFKKHVPVSYRRGTVVHKQLAAGKDVVIIETGYLNRGAGKHHHYAVGLNGLNGRAKFFNENSPHDRVKNLGVEVAPWRKDGAHVLLCGQVPWDASVDHINFIEWINKTAAKIQSLTDRKIVYRPHPLGFTPTPEGCHKSTNKLLADDLKDCWVCVTFNSNSAVEAAVAGVPVVADDAGSMAFAIANSLDEIENPRTPDRAQWLADLCYAQWTPEEMRQGKAWDQLFR